MAESKELQAKGKQEVVTPAEQTRPGLVFTPAVDIFETETAVVLEIELPGVVKEKVSVEVKENILTIKGERKHENEVQLENFYRRERSYGSFRRAFNLHYVVNPEKIKARFNDGVLRIEVPKPEKEKPKQVTVNVD